MGQPCGIVYSVILEGGVLYKGSAEDSVESDIGFVNDRIAAIGDLTGRRAAIRLDVRGKTD